MKNRASSKVMFGRFWRCGAGWKERLHYNWENNFSSFFLPDFFLMKYGLHDGNLDKIWVSTSHSQCVCFWARLLASSWLFLFVLILQRKWRSWNKFLWSVISSPELKSLFETRFLIVHVVSKILLKVQKDFPVQSVLGPSVLNFVVLCPGDSV